jgi:acetate kinase
MTDYEMGTIFLIFNAGSSSLKFSLLDAESDRTLAEGGIDWAAAPGQLNIWHLGQAAVQEQPPVRTHAGAVARVLDELTTGRSAPARAPAEIRAIGHRVVHGGDRYTSVVRVTPEVRRDVLALGELAPLHNPVSVQVIDAVEAAMPRVPQFAAFDTAFHATLSGAARTYAVPHSWTSDWRLRRYGFHGLSHAYCAARAAEMIGRPDLRLVIAHLGNGASASAVRNGICVDTSMGFTPLDGLVMGTRSGAVDPGLLIYLLRHKGLDPGRIDHALNYESGLLGMSGVSSDMRRVLDAAATGDPRASLAIDVYMHRLRQTIGAMAATLGGIDALVFTAGIGEHSAEIRRRACEGLGFLGVELDDAVNADCSPDADVASPASRARILVIATREDLTIMREMKRLINPQGAEGALS